MCFAPPCPSLLLFCFCRVRRCWQSYDDVCFDLHLSQTVRYGHLFVECPQVVSRFLPSSSTSHLWQKALFSL